jgi:hypothetical protein
MGKVDAFNAIAGIKTDNTELCKTYDQCSAPLVPADTVPVTLKDLFFILPKSCRQFFLYKIPIT